MELAPPSYEKATSVDHWDVIARYVHSRDLFSVALVCRQWHATFVSHLWGNPASHFGLENDAFYIALTRFRKSLRVTRLTVRSLTHTLRFPPESEEFYDGPHQEWVREILELLPNLQSLIVRGLPFFDHASLQALRSLKKQSGDRATPAPSVINSQSPATVIVPPPANALPTFSLRLLDVSRCANVTSHGLAEALGRFLSLSYLDLSFTHPAREASVLDSIKNLSGLQVLKLRGVGLKDGDTNILSKSIALRTRSLDIRDNLISDRSIHSLLDHCFWAPQPPLLPSGQRSPSLLPHLGSEMLKIYQGEDFEGYLRNAVTSNFINRLAIEDASGRGITHLYVSGNRISVRGTMSLLKSNRLHVLDVGSLIAAFPPSFQTLRSSPSPTTDSSDMQKLTPVFRKDATESMTFLRIDHALVTKETISLPMKENNPGLVRPESTSRPQVTLSLEHSRTPSNQKVVEHTAEPSAQQSELPGCPSQVTDTHNEDSGVHQPNLLLPTRQGVAHPPELPPQFNDSQREARLAAHTMDSHCLHPAMLPQLVTLVLTNVPGFSPTADVANRLILFIRQCAEEASWARQQAKLDYSLPPGRRSQFTALKHSERKVFGLQRLVLELAPKSGSRKLGRSTSWWDQSDSSMTEDRDSEAFWSASKADFSFFSDQNNEPSGLEPGHSMFCSGATEKDADSGERRPNKSGGQSSNTARSSMFDTIALISTFRKDRKLAHERSIAAGILEPEVEGFWPGNVQVVRFSNKVRSDEEVDYFGNRFTNG